jgi:hypothetical protein
VKRATGSHRRDDLQRIHPQIVVRFDRESFDEIAAFAEQKKLSFNAAVRLLTTWGLMTALKESGACPTTTSRVRVAAGPRADGAAGLMP